MNHNEHNSRTDLDDATLDRLVDGELNAADRRRVIAALDAAPDGWRRCALAFLQAQDLRRQLGAWTADNAVAAPAGVNSPQAVELAQRSGATASSTGLRALGWLAVAACLLVAFGLGWQTSLRSLSTPDGGQLLAQDDAAAQPSVAPAPSEPDAPDLAPPEVDPRDAVTLLVRDVSGTPQRLRVPLIEVNRGGDLANAANLPPALRQQLLDNGLDLKVRQRVVPLFFENNNELAPMIVPVNDAVITPVSRELF